MAPSSCPVELRRDVVCSRQERGRCREKKKRLASGLAPKTARRHRPGRRQQSPNFPSGGPRRFGPLERPRIKRSNFPHRSSSANRIIFHFVMGKVNLYSGPPRRAASEPISASDRDTCRDRAELFGGQIIGQPLGGFTQHGHMLRRHAGFLGAARAGQPRPGVSPLSIPPCGICQAGVARSARCPAKIAPVRVHQHNAYAGAIGQARDLVGRHGAVSVAARAQRVQAGEDVDGIGQLVILVPETRGGFGDGLLFLRAGAPRPR